ncbi:hypothetical protein [Cupriavidus pauculus]|uniref:hypothetical protein n=1 Tax=Cupriavidus pauculus TaxID=82633 RepID=UPI001CBFE86D|nr:hypothetical protein [Cupriavidus pauculus]MCM3606721.1 hypothetical protein [Cupriavidus pauculus]
MTQTEPIRLLTTRAVSCSPVSGWANYPLMIAVCSARGHARAAGLLTDISSFLAARRHNGRRGPIEYFRAPPAPEIRLHAGFEAGARISGRGESTALCDVIHGGFPVTEFISVRSELSRAPMNRSLDWGSRQTRLGSVGSSI